MTYIYSDGKNKALKLTVSGTACALPIATWIIPVETCEVASEDVWVMSHTLDLGASYLPSLISRFDSDISLKDH